ncbi:hypothetical protein [Methanogenium cariaci]|jgi:hypothetical protein|uniref:hypothetical protein n=1 Tax=Methanogenium cariaci TaxID=2197 RepID=UPI0012F653B2|nr:hypothetical protein [Methanogenium cariaci]
MEKADVWLDDSDDEGGIIPARMISLLHPVFTRWMILTAHPEKTVLTMILLKNYNIEI